MTQERNNLPHQTSFTILSPSLSVEANSVPKATTILKSSLNVANNSSLYTRRNNNNISLTKCSFWSATSLTSTNPFLILSDSNTHVTILDLQNFHLPRSSHCHRTPPYIFLHYQHLSFNHQCPDPCYLSNLLPSSITSSTRCRLAGTPRPLHLISLRRNRLLT